MGQHKHKKTQAYLYIRALSGILTLHPSVWAGEVISRPRPVFLNLYETAAQ
jgi:hypothetical protein